MTQPDQEAPELIVGNQHGRIVHADPDKIIVILDDGSACYYYLHVIKRERP
jgi:hypothetical protein